MRRARSIPGLPAHGLPFTSHAFTDHAFGNEEERLPRAHPHRARLRRRDRDAARARARICRARLGNRLLLKREDLQPVFSFKLRGAYNKMAQLPAAALKRGVIAASAGNHAQGVALAAQKLGCSGDDRDAGDHAADQGRGGARRAARRWCCTATPTTTPTRTPRVLARKRRLTFVHPYDDPDVIAGQGTIGMEILRQHAQPIHAIFVPIGGGGLIPGIAAYVKRLRPEIKVIGVEPDGRRRDVPLAQGRPARAARPGRAVRRRRGGEAGRRGDLPPVPRARRRRDPASTPTRSARRSRTCSRTRARSSSRPARWRSPAPRPRSSAPAIRDKTLVAVACGANMNFDRLRFVAEEAELGEQREAMLAVTIPERPGSFRDILLAGRRAQHHRVQLPLRRSRGRRTCSSACRCATARRPASLVAPAAAAGA